MDNINSLFKKYIKPSPNPNALSFAMVGLSTLMLVYFVAYKEDSPTEDKEDKDESRSLDDDDDSPYDSEQTTRGGSSKRRHKKNKKTKRRKL
jgi:hypothetical protein